MLTAPPVVVPAEDGLALLVTVPIDAALAGDSLADGESLTPTVVETVREALVDPLEEAGLAAWVTGPAPPDNSAKRNPQASSPPPSFIDVKPVPAHMRPGPVAPNGDQPICKDGRKTDDDCCETRSAP